MAHELSLRANALKEQHESQFEEHDGTNEGATTVCIGLLYKLPDKREIQGALQVPIDPVVLTLLKKQGSTGQNGALWFPSWHSALSLIDSWE